ncbi:MAG: phospholipase D-like domain-containing protein [Candidatus Woesearchaeota archaeon]
MNLALNIKYLAILFFLLTATAIAGNYIETFPNANNNNYLNAEINNLGHVEIKAYMCRIDDCEQIYINQINKAKESLHCAFFEYNLEDLNNAINSKKINKLLLIDRNSRFFNESFDYIVYDKRSAYMHNKFCIIDEKITITGSFNPTISEKNNNDNNVLIINSPEISEIYTLYFKELIKEQQSVERYRHQIEKRHYLKFINANISICFSRGGNCLDLIRKEVAKTEFDVKFMLFTMTDSSIANMLLLKHYLGINVEGMFETFLISRHSSYNIMNFHNTSVIRYRSPGKLHHKVFIIDNETVIAGSMNPSHNADNNNDENLIIIQNKEIASIYLQEYKRLKLTQI